MNTVVTGAGSGLGRVVSAELLAHGRPVVLLDRDREALHATQAELGARYDPEVSLIVADLSTPAGISAAADELRTQPELQGLVNNAGGGFPAISTRRQHQRPGSRLST